MKFSTAFLLTGALSAASAFNVGVVPSARFPRTTAPVVLRMSTVEDSAPAPSSSDGDDDASPVEAAAAALTAPVEEAAAVAVADAPAVEAAAPTEAAAPAEAAPAAVADAPTADAAPAEAAAPAVVADAPTADAAPAEAAAPAVADAPAAAADAAPAAPTGGDGELDVAKGDRQKLYGKKLDMPKTYVRCGRCGAAYGLQEEDLGSKGKGRRIECSVCSHSWFQARDRLFNLSDGFELATFPESDLDRISKNIEAGRPADFTGVAKFYVGNLSYDVTEQELLDAFGKAGQVGDVSIITDNETGRSRGFAFVTMFTEEDGKKALELDGSEVRGRRISVRPPNN